MNKKISLSGLFVVFAAILWGIDGIVLRPTLYTLPVPLVVLIESGIVVIILTPFLTKRFKNLKKLDKRDWLAFAAVGLFSGAIGTMAITKAFFYVNYVNLSIVIFIQKLQPLFALLLAWFMLKEKLPANFFLWALIAMIGTYLMTFGIELPDFNTEEKTIYAALFALIASASFGSSTVLSKRALKNISFEMATYLRFAISFLIMIVIAVSLGDVSLVKEISENQIIVFLLIAFITGGPAIFLYYYGLKKITASSATIFELAFPLTAVLLEYLIRDNILEWTQWFGVGLLLLSIFRINSFNKPNSKRPS